MIAGAGAKRARCMVQSIFGSSTANYWAAKLSAAQLESFGDPLGYSFWSYPTAFKRTWQKQSGRTGGQSGKPGQKHQKALNLLKVRSMFVVLLTLALWPCVAVKDEKVGMVVRSSAPRLPGQLQLHNDDSQLIHSWKSSGNPTIGKCPIKWVYWTSPYSSHYRLYT